MTPYRIFCIGRNYVDHIKELNNEQPEQMVIFMKPQTALGDNGVDIPLPQQGRSLHYEAEVVVQIGRAGKPASLEASADFIAALSLGLDLTLRDVQQTLKTKGLPWERAKAFDNSARVATWCDYNDDIDLENLEFQCWVNDQCCQEGNSKFMLYPILQQIWQISQIWSLLPGDLIFTGTPKGVGALSPGDTIRLLSQSLAVDMTYQLKK